MSGLPRPADEVLLRVLTDRASSADIKVLDDWLASSDDARSEWAKWQLAWTDTGAVEGPRFDVDQGWRDISRRLGLKPRRKLGLRLAMAAIFASCLVWLTVSVIPLMQDQAAWDLVERTASQRHFLRLADGTRVTLEPGSELHWRDGDQRQVELIGRAVFDVAHHERVFVVRTSEAQIEVLGTRFDVWARAEQTEIVLQRGRVRVIDADGQKLELTPQQKVVCSRLGFVGQVESVSENDGNGWPGALSFDRQPLRRIAAELAAQFQVPIELGAGVDPLGSVTAEFEGRDLAGILRDLGVTLDLNVLRDDSGYILALKDNEGS